jgi:TolB protein
MMLKTILPACAIAAGLATAALARQQPASPDAPAPPQQPSQIETTISTERGSQTRLAVPEFVALSTDKETVDAAATIARVLADDLNFEHEFALIPRDVVASVPRQKALDDINFDAWRELNVDGVIAGTVLKVDNGVRVQVRLFDIKGRRATNYSQEYSGSVANPRLFAHRISDDVHRTQRALTGVAQTKLVFASDRDGERLAGSFIQNRNGKELYVSDYDGENQRRVTVGNQLNNFAEWSPDARALAYTSWRAGPMQIFVQHIYDTKPLEFITKGSPGQSFLPAWSPDGTRIAFTSTRDGNPEIYVANADGSHVQRLTRTAWAEGAPTWSPNGKQIAFTSDRTGASQQQIWVMDADGLNSHQITHEGAADRPTWSPPPFNEIAFAGKNGPGFDIKIIDVNTLQVRNLTTGEGTNESPSFSPNGRHIAFNSTRAGKNQVFTINRMGQDLKQLTKAGNNERPNWSNGPQAR